MLFGDVFKSATKRKKEFVSDFLYSEFISEEINKFLVEKNIDYLFCFGNTILRSPLLNDYKNRIINFHPSILPSFPGLMAIDQALASSVQFLGNTAHIINKGIDVGPIIMQSVLKREAYSNYEDVLNLQIPMLKKIWLFLDADDIVVHENFVQINSEGSQNNSFFSV